MERTSKFNVGKDKTDRTFDGIVFDSSVEMKYYAEVILPGVEDGSILKFERQKKYILQPSYTHCGKKVQPIEYKADFYVVYADGREQVIDIKGCPDAVAKLKRKMFWYVYPNIEYVWIGFSKIDGGWTTYEAIQSGRKERKKLKQAKAKEKKDEQQKSEHKRKGKGKKCTESID